MQDSAARFFDFYRAAGNRTQSICSQSRRTTIIRQPVSQIHVLKHPNPSFFARKIQENRGDVYLKICFVRNLMVQKIGAYCARHPFFFPRPNSIFRTKVRVGYRLYLNKMQNAILFRHNIQLPPLFAVISVNNLKSPLH